MLLKLIVGCIGIAIVLVVMLDVFQSVVVPRAIGWRWRPSAVIVRFGWRTSGWVGMRFNNGARREDFYATFAPALLVTLIVVWVGSLVAGFGIVFYALRDELHPSPDTLWAAMYYAGTSLLTLGYGDITADRGISRAISLVAAAAGLGTFAITTAFLFSIFAAFQRRESFMTTLRERTGAPPSGLDFIERHVDLHMMADIGTTFKEAEMWMADMMETHLAYPALSYFRSNHDNQSWVGTMGALLDAATLVITTVDIDHVGRAKMLSRLGRHLVGDYTRYFRLPDPHSVGIERAEFDQAYERLRAKGVRMRDKDGAWQAFADLRATYAGPLNAMAVWWRIPPAQWIGDRSLIVSRHAPIAVVSAAPAGVEAPISRA